MWPDLRIDDQSSMLRSSICTVTEIRPYFRTFFGLKKTLIPSLTYSAVHFSQTILRPIRLNISCLIPVSIKYLYQKWQLDGLFPNSVVLKWNPEDQIFFWKIVVTIFGPTSPHPENFSSQALLDLPTATETLKNINKITTDELQLNNIGFSDLQGDNYLTTYRVCNTH